MFFYGGFKGLLFHEKPFMWRDWHSRSVAALLLIDFILSLILRKDNSEWNSPEFIRHYLLKFKIQLYWVKYLKMKKENLFIMPAPNGWCL